MKKKLFLLLLFLCPVFAGSAFQFRIGEQFRYKIKVMGIHVGFQDMALKGYRTLNGKRYLYAVADTRSLPFIEKVYKYVLHDVIEVWMEPDTLLPVLIKKDIHEGSWKNKITIVMDQKKRTAIYYDKRNKKGKKYTLQGPTLDLLSMIYYLRSRKPGNRKIKINYFDEKKGVTETEIDIRRSGSVKIHSGLEIPVYMYSQRRGHKIQVKLTGDKHRFPIKITVATFQVHGYSIDIVGTLLKIK